MNRSILKRLLIINTLFLSVLILCINQDAKAQSPGGVNTSLKAWFKADKEVSNSQNTVTSWNNQVLGAVDLLNVKGAPLILNSGLNFNPTIKFSGLDFISTNSGIIGSNFFSASNNTMFIVFNSSSLNTNGGVIAKWESGSRPFGNRVSWELNPNKSVRFDFPQFGLGANTGNSAINGSKTSSSIIDTTAFIGSAITNGIVDTLNINGLPEAIQQSSSLVPSESGLFQLGGNYNSGLNGYKGNISEIIFFDSHLTLSDRRKVSSYLAIKYGISLGNTSSPISYLASDGITKPWVGNVDYQNNIAGIGRDDNSELNQKQSKSININSLVTMSLGDIKASNAENTNSFATNKSFLMWGDDNLSLSSKGVNDLPTSIISRIERTWLAQETGNVGTVRFRYSLKGTTLGTICIDYASLKLLVDKDGAFATGAKIISPVSFDQTAQTIDFDVDFNALDGYYFTLGSTQAIGSPIANNISQCLNKVESPLVAVGNDLHWYTSETGGDASLVAPTPSSATVGTVLYWVSQVFGSCESERTRIDVETKPIPTVSATNAEICSGTISNISLNSSLSNSVFSWVSPTQINAVGGQASLSSPDKIIQTLNATSTGQGTVIYQVRATKNSCTGPPTTVTVKVNPKPVLTLTANDTTICSGSVTDIRLEASLPNATFSWSTPSQTLATGGTASVENPNKISQLLTTTSNQQGVVKYLVSALANSCVGDQKTISVLVNPVPIISGNNDTICSGENLNIQLNSNISNATFSWNTPVQTNVVGGAAGSTTSNLINQSLNSVSTSEGIAQFTVTANANSCISNSLTLSAYVIPRPLINLADQSICSGSSSNVILNSNINNSTFSWTSPLMENATGATASVGNPLIINQTLINNSTSIGKVKYPVVASYKGCIGNTDTVLVEVKPIPSVLANDTTICSGSNINVNLSSNLNNTTFTWISPTQNLTTGGHASIGQLNVINQTLTTTSSNTGTVIYNVIPSNNNCTGVAKTVTATINPLPVTIVESNNYTICSGATTNIKISAKENGTQFTWTNPIQTNVSGGTSGDGNTIAQQLLNTTTSNGTAIYKISSVAKSCKGADQNVTVNVNPKLNISANDTTICSGTPINILLKSNVGGTSFSWNLPTQNNVLGAAASVGNEASINQTLSTASETPVEVKYKIIANSNSCIDSSLVVTVAVKPKPIVSANDTTICSGQSINVKLKSITGTTFSWANPIMNNVTGGVADNANVINQTLTNNTNSVGSVKYSVIPTLNSCVGNPKSINVLVNNLPSISVTASSDSICKNQSVKLMGAGASTYLWDNAVVDNTLFNPLTTTTYNVIGTDVNGCKNTATKTIYVKELPTVKATSFPDKICLGGKVTLRGTGAKTYVWNKGVTNNVEFSPLNTEKYTVIGTAANGCQNKDSIIVDIESGTPPTISISKTNDNFCRGGSTTLEASGADIYVWDNNVINAVSFTPDSTKTFTVIGTASNGCKASAVVDVTVNQLPIIKPTATKDTICIGDSLVLNATGAVGYSWNLGVLNNIYFKPTLSQTYEVTGTDVNGCIGTASKSVVVNQLPIISINSLRDTVCNGGFTKLTASGALTYVWDNGLKNDVLFKPTATDTFNVKGTDINKCSNTASKIVVVTANIPPTVIAKTSLDSVCAGESITLTGDGVDSYEWDNGISNGVSFIPDSTRTYSVLGTNNAGCNNVASVKVIVHQLPKVNIVPSKNPLCLGDSILLEGQGALTYNWDNGVINKQKFVPTTSKKYKVNATDIYGCKNSSEISVVVNTLPIVGASVSKPVVCLGDSVSFSATGALNYVWDNGVINNKNYIPTEDKVYTVSGKDINNCSAVDTVFVKVKSLPNVSATASNDSVCKGGATILKGLGANIYVWDKNVIDSISFVPNFTQTYKLIGTGLNGCSNDTTIKVTVTDNILFPIKALASKDSICYGNSVTLSGTGALNYVWNYKVENDVAFTPDSTKTYKVTGTNQRGCKAVDSVSVVVNQLPIIKIKSSKDTICNGDSISLTASGALTFTWDNGIVNNKFFESTISKTYSVEGVDKYGCTNTNSISILVNDLPKIKANASSTKICNGDAVYLNGSGAESYIWDNGVLNNESFKPNTTKTYKLLAFDKLKCSNTDSISITVNELPTVTATASKSRICLEKPVLLKAQGASTYIWSNNVIDSVQFYPTTSSTYTVTGTDTNGCKNTYSLSIEVDTLPISPVVTDVSICKGSVDNVDLNTKVIGSNIKWYQSSIDGIELIPTPLVDNSTTSTKSYFVTQTNQNGCESSPRKQINVEVNEIPVSEILSSQSSYCSGKENGVLLKLQEVKNAKYKWFRNSILQSDTTNSLNNALAGNWTAIVDVKGCKDTSVVVAINEKPLPKPVIIASGLEYCKGVNNIKLSVKDTSSTLTYQWFNNGVYQNSVKNLNNIEAGNWTLSSTLNGCSDTSATTTIIEKAIPVAEIITPTDSLFYYTGKAGVTLKAQNAGTDATYEWYKNGNLINITNEDSIVDAKKGNWALIVNKNGCSNSNQTVIDIVELNLAPVAINDSLITDYLTTITFKITQNDYDPDGIIIDNTADLNTKLVGLQQTIIKKDTGVVFVDQGGFLTYVPDAKFTGTLVIDYNVKDNSGNVSKIGYVVISVGPHIFDDYMVTNTNTTAIVPVLNNDISKTGFDISSIDLDPFTNGVQSEISKSGFGSFKVLADGTVEFIPEKDIETIDSIFYQLADNKGALSNIAVIKIKVRSTGVIIPDGFSPNGDSNHDYFAIYNPAEHVINVEIYNRWGNLVYEKSNYNNEFVGKSNAGGIVVGEDLPDGTYFGTFEIRRIDGTKERIMKPIMIKR